MALSVDTGYEVVSQTSSVLGYAGGVMQDFYVDAPSGKKVVGGAGYVMNVGQTKVVPVASFPSRQSSSNFNRWAVFVVIPNDGDDYQAHIDAFFVDEDF